MVRERSPVQFWSSAQVIISVLSFFDAYRLVRYTRASMPMPKKSRPECLMCGREPARASYKYCSNICQREFEYREYIQLWRLGKVHGLQSIGVVSGHIKRFLREKYTNRCVVCGWSMMNPVTGLVPLVADHINGDWQDNTESNLRLICPNCDSLTPTYAGLNRGRGRNGRVISKRTLEARTMIGMMPK